MPVAYCVECLPVARRNAVSSTPIARTPASRVGSSTSSFPWLLTWVMMVCQDTPSSPATPR